MIKIAICHDRKAMVNQIENTILELSKIEKIPADTDVFYCGKALEKEIAFGTKYDLIFLDIQMKAGDGISTAQNIRRIDENVLLICISGDDKNIMELFQLDVYAFIKKPIDREIFEKTFLKAYGKICSKMIYFTFCYKYQEYKILCKDILYFESSGRKITLYVRNGDIYTFNQKLSEVEEKISDGNIPFIRIHQSFLVNYHLIRSRSKAEITLIDGTRLPVSGDRQKDFSRHYNMPLDDEACV